MFCTPEHKLFCVENNRLFILYNSLQFLSQSVSFLYLFFSKNAAAILYLEYCYKKLKSKESSVHTFLVASYANSSNPEDHKKLLEYLSSESLVRWLFSSHTYMYMYRCPHAQKLHVCTHMHRHICSFAYAFCVTYRYPQVMAPIRCKV